jgi:hypothetical protein
MWLSNPKKTDHSRWQTKRLLSSAHSWVIQKKSERRAWGDLSPWWSFLYEWPKKIDSWLKGFVEGAHTFSPMKIYHFSDEVVTLWNCEDRLILFLLSKIIKSTFKCILSPLCFSAQGISGVKSALSAVVSAFKARNFKYVIRLDIKSYYASVDHKVLLQQLNLAFKDQRLLKYLRDVVTIGIDNNAVLSLPTKGIPRRSSLSPFFGALYLTPLDRAFESRKGIFYARYMDDIVILLETKSQFVRAKKRVKKELASLKLKMSPHKTKMGKLDTFHFLGVNFTLPENMLEMRGNEQSKDHDSVTDKVTLAQKNRKLPKTYAEILSPHLMERFHGDNDSVVSTAATQIAAETQTQVTMQLHPRSCRRALDKANSMKEGAVHPATVQNYLLKWATWWKRATESRLPVQHNLLDWVKRARTLKSDLEWLGRGILDFRLSSQTALR